MKRLEKSLFRKIKDQQREDKKMKRVEVNYMNEVKEIIERAKEATVYQDKDSGKYVIEYYIK